MTPNGWILRNPIDTFIAAKLAERGLKQADESERYRLVRRVCLDLTGLPPTLELLDECLSDPSDDWYERLVDRLLASPQYGSAWSGNG